MLFLNLGEALNGVTGQAANRGRFQPIEQTAELIPQSGRPKAARQGIHPELYRTRI